MLDKILASRRLRFITALILAISLLLLTFSLAYPAMKRAERIDYVGTTGLSATSSLSTAMTYFAGDSMSTLRQNPTQSEDYRNLCGLLTRIKDGYGFERVYVIYKGVGGKAFYLLDAGYRDNATAGVDYQVPGTEFTGPVQKASRSVIDRVLNQKDAAAFCKDIITTNDHRKVIASYVPLYDKQGQVLGLLVVESPAGNTDFAKLGPVDFQVTAMVSGGIAAVALLILVALARLSKSRAAKAEKVLEANATSVTAEIVPATEASGESSADSTPATPGGAEVSDEGMGEEPTSSHPEDETPPANS